MSVSGMSVMTRSDDVTGQLSTLLSAAVTDSGAWIGKSDCTSTDRILGT